MTGIASFVLLLVTGPMLMREWIPEHIEPSFFWIVLFGGLFYYLGKYFNFQSLALGDISLIAPMKGLITLATIFEYPPPRWVGEYLWFSRIFLTLAGTYYLAVEKSHIRFSDPIKALYETQGLGCFSLPSVSMVLRWHLIVWGLRRVRSGFGRFSWMLLYSWWASEISIVIAKPSKKI